MRIDRSFLGWGIFFIVVGGVVLAVRGGYLTTAQVGDWWRFWPVILIGIGVGFLFRRTPLEALGGIVVAGAFGLMAGGALSVGTFAGIGSSLCGSTTEATAFPSRDGDLGGGPSRVDLSLDCGDLALTTQPGTAWRLDGLGPDGVGPMAVQSGSDLSIRSVDTNGALFGLLSTRATWRLALPADTPLDIGTEVNAGSARMAFDDATLAGATIEVNAGSATLDLGRVRAIDAIDVTLNAGSLGVMLPAAGTTGTLQVNAGALRLCAPPGVALRIRTGDSIVSSYDFAGHGLVQSGSSWSSPGFDTAGVRIDLRTEANAGSVTLDPKEGCGG